MEKKRKREKKAQQWERALGAKRTASSFMCLEHRWEKMKYKGKWREMRAEIKQGDRFGGSLILYLPKQ